MTVGLGTFSFFLQGSCLLGPVWHAGRDRLCVGFDIQPGSLVAGMQYFLSGLISERWILWGDRYFGSLTCWCSSAIGSAFPWGEGECCTWHDLGTRTPWQLLVLFCSALCSLSSLHSLLQPATSLWWSHPCPPRGLSMGETKWLPIIYTAKSMADGLLLAHLIANEKLLTAFLLVNLDSFNKAS